jgi:hypothetical protein
MMKIAKYPANFSYLFRNNMIQDPDLSLHALLFIKRNLIFPKKKLIIGHSYRGGSSLITRLFFDAFDLSKFVQKSGLASRRFRDLHY